MVRAAAASYWQRGVDGLYTWFMNWPLQEEERGILSQLGDPDLVREGDKHYIVCRRSDEGRRSGYEVPLPLEIPRADKRARYEIPFFIADDIAGRPGRIRQVLLRINISNIVTQDRLAVLLNGQSLAGERCLRAFGRGDSARDQWLEFHLEAVRPVQGHNVLEIALLARPPRLAGGVRVEEVEILVEYGPHPSGLKAVPMGWATKDGELAVIPEDRA